MRKESTSSVNQGVVYKRMADGIWEWKQYFFESSFLCDAQFQKWVALPARA